MIFSLIMNFLDIIFIVRKFLKTEELSNNSLMRVLSIEEKFEFIRTTVSWIEGKDIIDTCFVLNFGHDASLPWPQVEIRLHTYGRSINTHLTNQTGAIETG